MTYSVALSSLGLIRPARMVFHEDVRYTVKVLLAVVCSALWSLIETSAGGWIQWRRALPPKSAMAAYGAYIGVSGGMLPQKCSENNSGAQILNISQDSRRARGVASHPIHPPLYQSLRYLRESIRFQSKNLRIWTHPLARHDSASCPLWFIPPQTPAFHLKILCPCKSLYAHLNAIKWRAIDHSPGHKEKWTNPSSNAAR